MNFTQALRVLADHVHVAEDIREALHEAIDGEAGLRGEPARAKVADNEARLAALKGDGPTPEGA
jgi:hypothetical protein